MSDTLRIVEVDTTRPLDQFLRAQTNAIVDRAATENAIRHSWAKQGLLLTEFADELEKIMEDEGIMNAISLDMHDRLMNLLWRVRKS
jgi:hypothetical protein